jgi:aminoglycoside 6'-N-acetyltransferase
VSAYEFSEPIRTDRLALRPLVGADVDDVFAWMSDPDVARYQMYEPRTRERVAEHVAKSSGRLALRGKGDWMEFGLDLEGRIIGIIYFCLSEPDDGTAEIGWALTGEYHGRGYAFEAATAVLNLAFGQLEMHRVQADLDPRNAASIRLCERLGMRHEATFIENLWFKGTWADTGIYAVLGREWAERHPD